MPLEEARFESLGSSCHVLGVDLPAERLSWALDWVSSRHRRYSRFLPESELSRFNAAAGDWVGVSSELEEMLRTALEAYESSGGLVHAGVLPAMLAIGYTRPISQGPTRLSAAPPPPAPLPEMLEVKAGQARLRPGTAVDLGGIAKGWLADRLASELGGVCLVNLGGDLFARGGGPEGQGWPVGLGGATLLLHNQGAATSGTWRRRWEASGSTVHHLIDPRSGRPAQSDLREVSVVASTATVAEVCAKTALLLGSSEAAAYLQGSALAWSMG
jgi:FAD:protein FMN transferase